MAGAGSRPAPRVLAPFNKYVFVSKDGVLLIDTGVAAHGPALIESLRRIVGSRWIMVVVTRIELDCTGNLAGSSTISWCRWRRSPRTTIRRWGSCIMYSKRCRSKRRPGSIMGSG